MCFSLGVFAHVDHGKTTLSENILLASGALKSAGRVDKKTALLDFSPAERDRGISVFSGSAFFEYMGRDITLIDTPGHMDFFPKAERALMTVDCAVLTVSAKEGAESGTENAVRAFKERNLPFFVFLNKCDLPSADIEGAVKSLDEITGGVVDFSEGFSEKGFSESLMERLCDEDDFLTELYLNGDFDGDKWTKRASELIESGRLHPMFRGSALSCTGVKELMEGICSLFPRSDIGESFGGTVCKITVEDGQIMTHVKITSGSLKVKDNVTSKYGDFKVQAIMRPFGQKMIRTDRAQKGMTVALTGLSGIPIGAALGCGKEFSSKHTPIMTCSVTGERDSYTLLKCFKELELEEPLLNPREEGGALHIDISGEIEQEVIKSEFPLRFGFGIDFGKRRMIYKETLKSPVLGCGHFEPLRHYSEIHFLMLPAEHGSGISYESDVHINDFPKNYQNLVEDYVMQNPHKGVLTGSELTDVRIILEAGRFDLKHTFSGDLFESASRAIRQGLMEGECILLEPFYSFELKTEPNIAGKVLKDLTLLKAEAELLQESDGSAVIKGRGSAEKIEEYSKVFMSMTSGRGIMRHSFIGYYPSPFEKEIIESVGYDAESDRSVTADSVFFDKGTGYNVPWDKVKNLMHTKVQALSAYLK